MGNLEADLIVKGGIFSVTVVMLYAALASVLVWYEKISLLGFDPTK